MIADEYKFISTTNLEEFKTKIKMYVDDGWQIKPGNITTCMCYTAAGCVVTEYSVLMEKG